MRRCTDIDGKQTELEFAYSLWSRTSNECRGPLVKLGLRDYAYEEICAALDRVDATDILKAAAVGDATPRGGQFQMCSAHWFDLVMVVGGMAEAYEQPIWGKLRGSLFIMVSRASGWDYREMENRFTSFYQAKLAGK